MKQELQAQLDELGVTYDKRWGEKKLREALEKASLGTGEVVVQSEAVEEPIERPVVQKQEESGIMEEKEYHIVIDGESSIVYRKDKEIRTYSLEIHGENYSGLAKQFVDKMNK
jgi:hypothetical protein